MVLGNVLQKAILLHSVKILKKEYLDQDNFILTSSCQEYDILYKGKVTAKDGSDTELEVFTYKSGEYAVSFDSVKSFKLVENSNDIDMKYLKRVYFMHQRNFVDREYKFFCVDLRDSLWDGIDNVRIRLVGSYMDTLHSRVGDNKKVFIIDPSHYIKKKFGKKFLLGATSAKPWYPLFGIRDDAQELMGMRGQTFDRTNLRECLTSFETFQMVEVDDFKIKVSREMEELYRSIVSDL